MIPTVFGALVAGVAFPILLRGTVWDALRLVLVMTLLGGSAAVILSSGSSIPPAIPAMLVLVARIWQDRGRLRGAIAAAPGAGAGPMLFFALYGVVGAFLLPRIFARAMLVAPMQPLETGGLFAVAPLTFTAQNVNAAVYLIFTATAFISGFIAARGAIEPRALARFAAVLALVHAGFGWYDIVTRGTPAWVLIDLFRNANYAMLQQGAGILPRMAGIFPEPSAFAAYGFAWCVLCSELWIRRIEPGLTGSAAAVMALSLVISTSSSAYLSLAAYALILLVRIVYLRGGPRGRQMGIVLFGLLGAVVAALAMAILLPTLAKALATVLGDMTTGKVDSESGLQRGFWARQGIDAFAVSAGLGIGPGSFRSSSIATAILGSVGVPGTAAILIVLGMILRATWRASQQPTRNDDAALAASLGCTALVMLVPAFAGAASPDPGLLWGLIAGGALGFASRTATDGADPAPRRPMAIRA